MEKQIEVITYEQDRLNYFTDLMKKAQERYKRLFKKHKDAPYASEEAQALSDAGRETHFLGDVVGMLEKGNRKQSEPISCGHEKGVEWKWISDDDVICSACGKVFYTADNADAGLSIWSFCPNCGAKMKGGAE